MPTIKGIHRAETFLGELRTVDEGADALDREVEVLDKLHKLARKRHRPHIQTGKIVVDDDHRCRVLSAGGNRQRQQNNEDKGDPEKTEARRPCRGVQNMQTGRCLSAGKLVGLLQALRGHGSHVVSGRNGRSVL